MRLVARVDDRPLQRRLEPNLDLEEVGPLRDLEAVLATVLADANATGTHNDLTRDEEGRQMPHDVGERRLPAHQVVLVTAVRRTLVVGVVLVELDQARAWNGRGRMVRSSGHHALPRLVPDHRIARVGDFRRGVFGVRVVDVQARAVGEDDVGETDLVVGHRIG